MVLHKNFWDTKKNCENKNISSFCFDTTFWIAWGGKGQDVMLTKNCPDITKNFRWEFFGPNFLEASLQ